MGSILASRIIFRFKALRSSFPEKNYFSHFQEGYFEQESLKKIDSVWVQGSLLRGRCTKDRDCPRFPPPGCLHCCSGLAQWFSPYFQAHKLSRDPYLLTVLLKMNTDPARAGRGKKMTESVDVEHLGCHRQEHGQPRHFCCGCVTLRIFQRDQHLTHYCALSAKCRWVKRRYTGSISLSYFCYFGDHPTKQCFLFLSKHRHRCVIWQIGPNSMFCSVIVHLQKNMS